jgi:hypothetical protein
MQRSSEKGKVPKPFTDMIEYLRSKEIQNIEGIFRVSGYADEIQDYRLITVFFLTNKIEV